MARPNTTGSAARVTVRVSENNLDMMESLRGALETDNSGVFRAGLAALGFLFDKGGLEAIRLIHEQAKAKERASR